LDTSMSQNESLGPALLLRFCGEIPKGVHTVHQYGKLSYGWLVLHDDNGVDLNHYLGVIHGDINPRNILIWHDVHQLHHD
jgi:hypothetical protein